MEKILKRFNPWWYEEYHTKGIKRGEYLGQMRKFLDWPHVVFLVGLRRVGKTTLMKQFIEERARQIDPKKILYISLDHPIFSNLSILDIVEEFKILNGIPSREKVEIFLDEVHLHQGFERDLKVLHDMENTKIFASGSASIFLLEKGSYLTGRQHFIEVSPFNFKEYMKLLDIKIDEGDENLMINHSNRYAMNGGLPEYIKLDESIYITELVDSIIYKDIVSRHSIDNAKVLKDLVLLLSQNVGNRLSMRKISRILGVSHQSISNYISYFIETKLIELVEKNGKVSERKASPKKVYFVDNGIINVLSPSINRGALIENMVYNELKKMGEPIYHVKSRREVDFLIDDIAVEVKYRDRIDNTELKPLFDLGSSKRKFVITRSLRETRDEIEMIPFHRILVHGIEIFRP